MQNIYNVAESSGDVPNFYLVSPKLNVNCDINWRIWHKDCLRQREQQQRKPDDEYEKEQQRSTHAILHNSSSLDPTLQWIGLSSHNYQDMTQLLIWDSNCYSIVTHKCCGHCSLQPTLSTPGTRNFWTFI